MRDAARVAMALSVLVATDWALKLFGLKPVHDFVTGNRPAIARDEKSRIVVRRWAEALARARTWRISQRTDDCLCLALASAYLLRSRGVRATVVIGVRKYPFAAHAWVETDWGVIQAARDRHVGFVRIWVD